MSDLMEMLVRRGFFWQSFEIYGGMAGFVDYAPLGNNLRRKIENIWREFFVINERVAEIDTPLIGIEEIFIASGHATSFVDTAIQCKNCERVYRADHYIKEKLNLEVESSMDAIKELLQTYKIRCECGGEFSDPFPMNLMFSTKIGAGHGKRAYLRPETAQGIFVDFRRLSSYFRDKLPFGVAQIGRAFRNEISPRQGLIRLREFNQAELEFFVHPGEKRHPNFVEVAKDVVKLIDKFDKEHETTLEEAVNKGTIANEILAYFIGKTRRFLLAIGIKDEKLRFRQHKDNERAHYATDCWDAEVLTSFGWIEIVGIADRTDYDLSKHSKFSGENLSVFIPFSTPRKIKKRKVVPKMSSLGPVFKAKAKKIAEILEKLDVNSDEIEIEVDGEKIRLTKEFFEIKEVEEEVTGEKIIPHVIEPSFGLDRISYAVLEHCYDKDIVEGEERRVLRLKRRVTPIEVAVLPLLSREPFTSKAIEIASNLRNNGLYTEYDDSGSIGRRYRRFDEIGTPFCITVDHQTFEDDTVTIRDRDSTKQVRVKIRDLVAILRDLLNSERPIEDFGEVFR